MKLKAYKFDKTLTNCRVSLKIDGVQAIRENNEWLSRQGKPLYNLPDMPDGTYEVFVENWEKSISASRTQIGADMVNPKHLYMLEPTLDIRLTAYAEGQFPDELHPTYVRTMLAAAVAAGHEGLCIRCDQGHFKVKPVDTYDVVVTGMQKGTGKFEGMMGALITDMGKVGTGFSNRERIMFYAHPTPYTIEVACMGLTPGGKFRHPRFVRLRWDK